MWKNWKCDVTWSLPPPPCHKLSHFIIPPLERDILYGRPPMSKSSFSSLHISPLPPTPLQTDTHHPIIHTPTLQMPQPPQSATTRHISRLCTPIRLYNCTVHTAPPILQLNPAHPSHRFLWRAYEWSCYFAFGNSILILNHCSVMLVNVITCLTVSTSSNCCLAKNLIK